MKKRLTKGVDGLEKIVFFDVDGTGSLTVLNDKKCHKAYQGFIFLPKFY
ncbi:Uncharacterised protein [Alloiococcus otitis]|nr:Uncharacterised protein [Alloiococcus otitis]